MCLSSSTIERQHVKLEILFKSQLRHTFFLSQYLSENFQFEILKDQSTWSFKSCTGGERKKTPDQIFFSKNRTSSANQNFTGSKRKGFIQQVIQDSVFTVNRLLFIFWRTLHNIMKTERGGSVVTHETRIREVPGSNPGADQLYWGFFVVFHSH